MSFDVTLASQRAHVAEVRMPARGIWGASVELDDDKALPIGTLATLTIGGLELEGFVKRGRPYAQTAQYVVVGGAGGWHKTVKARSYRPGAKLSTALKDLALDCGESFESGFGPGFAERVVGALARPSGIAAQHLITLVGRAWYVDDTGLTVIGDRPSSKADGEVLDFDPKLRRVTLSSDRPERVRPGQTVTVDDLTFTLGRVVARTGKGGALFEGWGQA